jgi:hypothetical protein
MTDEGKLYPEAAVHADRLLRDEALMKAFHAVERDLIDPADLHDRRCGQAGPGGTGSHQAAR